MIERAFEYKSLKSPTNGEILLHIGYPVETNEEDWECEYVLKLPERTLEGKIVGMDSLQALLLTLKHAKTLLTAYAKNNELTLSWLGMENMGLELITD